MTWRPVRRPLDLARVLAEIEKCEEVQADLAGRTGVSYACRQEDSGVYGHPEYLVALEELRSLLGG